ncbi:hypothetical protein VaNZ11_014231 [Volvox africanus]|uniref:Uncharacterized protein n=1 Tax=Volvox africanus TaxID=51714 RepID=A0ABQ5SI01_9CHLO|nr:hypothetical protein VaNZ11_014231 [Volvox africanus]
MLVVGAEPPTYREITGFGAVNIPRGERMRVPRNTGEGGDCCQVVVATGEAKPPYPPHTYTVSVVYGIVMNRRVTETELPPPISLQDLATLTFGNAAAADPAVHISAA